MGHKAVILADGGPRIGVGHVMRCATLAEELVARGWSLTWMANELPEALARRVRRVAQLEPCALEAAELAARVARARPRWILLDRPGASLEVQTALRSVGAALLVLDDTAANAVVADAIWNGNFDAEALSYSASQGTQMMLGCSFALVHPDFARARASARREGRHLLLTFGGADPPGLTLRALEALRTSFTRGSITVLVGCANARSAEIEEAAKRMSVETRVIVDATDVPRQMARADVAVIPGGVTVYECMAAGLPCLFLPMGEEQRFFLERIARRGFGEVVTAETLSDSLATLLDDVSRRVAMSEIGSSLVDGGGAARVAQLLEHHRSSNGS